MLTQNRSRNTLGVACLLTLLLSACGGGGGGGGDGNSPPPVPPANRAPVATNERVRADGASLDSIAVLANDTDPDGNPLTVTIEENAPVGTASVNANGTVALKSLPSGFKGVTRFKYRVSDPAGLTSVATTAVFVGADPFRVLFAGDASSNGSNEVYLTDFVSAPVAVTRATENTLRLRGFVASENGATVVYRRDTGSAGTSDLSYVRTATPDQQVRITLPAGTTLVQDAQGNDQFRVSPDGRWIAFIVRDAANVSTAYVKDATTSAAATPVTIASTSSASLPKFSSNSQSLYLLASPTTNGANRSLYTHELGTTNVAMISAPNAVVSADDVEEYAVSSDQSRILLQANRGGRVGLYFVDAAALRTEVRVSHALGPLESLVPEGTTVNLTPGFGGSARLQRVAYTTQTAGITSTYIAEISATPNPRLVEDQGARVIGLRPDDAALLYRKNLLIYEAAIDAGTADTVIGAGATAWYDSTGNIVMLQQDLPSGGSPATYPGLAVTTRAAFSDAQPLGTAGLAASYFSVSGFDRAVVIVGEGATTGTPPSSARLALVNAIAPDKLIYLADFQSPLNLTTDSARVVSN
jgi:hypothetical protein